MALDDLDLLLGVTEEDKAIYAAMARKCCGRTNAECPDDVAVRCPAGNCTEWLCACGEPRGMSAGPVGCPCQNESDLGGPWTAQFGDGRAERQVNAAADEHFPPRLLDGFRLVSANEATRIATYRAADAEGVSL